MKNGAQPLPTAEQLNAHRDYLKEKIANLEKQHQEYKTQAESYKGSGEKLMSDAMDSCAANIWTTRAEIQHVLDAFNEMYPEPKA